MLKQLYRLERTHELIRRRGTGSPKELAAKLEISPRQVYNMIELMKELGAPIRYSKSLKTYFYEQETMFSFGFK